MIFSLLFLFPLLFTTINGFRNPSNFTTRVAISISIDDEPKGEFYIGFWRDGLEQTVDNFMGLCLGRADIKPESGHKFDLKGLFFYEIMEDQYMKSGDISPEHNWGGNQTILQEGLWRAEFSHYLYEPGIIVTQQTENMDTGSEFSIWIVKGDLHPSNVAFGLVYQGLELVKYAIKTAGTNIGVPKRDVKITGCRVLHKQ